MNEAPQGKRRKRPKCWRFRRLPSSLKTRSDWPVFLARAALTPTRIRDAAATPGFLAGVLEHMLGDESLLLAFADSAGLDPAEIARVRRALGGEWERDLP